MTPLPPAENPTPQPVQTAGADEFAADVQSFWEKNRSKILMLCVAGLVGILAYEAWKFMQSRREQGVRAEYAAVAGEPAKLSRFAEENDGHPLAGVAHLRVADEAYSKGDFKGAAASYQKAAGELEKGALKDRAQLGQAMSQLAAGDKSGAETALKAIASGTDNNPTIRAEANYHLAVLAREAGKNDEVTKYLDEVNKIEAAGLWAQQAFMLRAQLETAKPATPATSPEIQFKPGS